MEGGKDWYGLQRVLFGAFYGYDLTEFPRCWACRGLFSFYPYRYEGDTDPFWEGMEPESFRKSTRLTSDPQLESKESAGTCAEALVAVACADIPSWAVGRIF